MQNVAPICVELSICLYVSVCVCGTSVTYLAQMRLVHSFFTHSLYLWCTIILLMHMYSNGTAPRQIHSPILTSLQIKYPCIFVSRSPAFWVDCPRVCSYTRMVSLTLGPVPISIPLCCCSHLTAIVSLCAVDVRPDGQMRGAWYIHDACLPDRSANVSFSFNSTMRPKALV